MTELAALLEVPVIFLWALWGIVIAAVSIVSTTLFLYFSRN